MSQPPKANWTSLCQAVLQSNSVLVKLLLEAGADPNHVLKRDASVPTIATVPHLACRLLAQEHHPSLWPCLAPLQQRWSVLLLLLKHKANIEGAKLGGQPLLNETIATRNREGLGVLLRCKADVNEVCAFSGLPPLHVAVQKIGQLEINDIVGDLLAAKADPSQKNSQRFGRGVQTPLLSFALQHMQQTENGSAMSPKDVQTQTRLKLSQQLIELLLSSVTNITETDDNGRFPLLFAIEKGHESIVKSILNANANVSQACDREVSDPLLQALMKDAAADDDAAVVAQKRQRTDFQ
eukprot:TRINITY_DN25951_c0_g1_i1.p1 TRINITY_DN25951_c0_g1~~TRINITY_DN25951_c0_g1_i1.p1  ORF type:complete len:295 (-),score=52.71 TRINITY_DN25951_c0_g1_i1:980-1864(-)